MELLCLLDVSSFVHVFTPLFVCVQSSVRKGVLPSMLEEILNTRIMVKQSMKTYKQDKALMRLLDARQLGLKLIANVTFGYTAANYSGRMPSVEVSSLKVTVSCLHCDCEEEEGLHSPQPTKVYQIWIWKIQTAKIRTAALCWLCSQIPNITIFKAICGDVEWISHHIFSWETMVSWKRNANLIHVKQRFLQNCCTILVRQCLFINVSLVVSRLETASSTKPERPWREPSGWSMTLRNGERALCTETLTGKRLLFSTSHLWKSIESLFHHQSGSSRSGRNTSNTC